MPGEPSADVPAKAANSVAKESAFGALASNADAGVELPPAGEFCAAPVDGSFSASAAAKSATTAAAGKARAVNWAGDALPVVSGAGRG
jgi:hypothetical protein